MTPTAQQPHASVAASQSPTHPAPTRRIPLLALHGFTGCGADFQWLAAQTADLFDWHTPDLPGHGKNARAPLCQHSPTAIARQIDDTLQSIGSHPRPSDTQPTIDTQSPTDAQPQSFTDAQPSADAQSNDTPPTGIQPIDGAQPAIGADTALPLLLGYSMGGRMALRYLARYGTDKVRGVILIGSSAGLPSAHLRRARRHADRALCVRIQTEGIAAFMRYWNSLPLIQSQSQSPYFTQLQQTRRHNSPQGLVRSLQRIGSGAVAPLHARLSQINVPCLLLTGAEDTKFTFIAAELARSLPNAKHITIENAGHSPHWENPKATVAAVRHWVGSR